MNAYTARGQVRMQLDDVWTVLRAVELPAGAAVATLEWHRGYQADAEVARLLRQHEGTPQAGAARVEWLRQRIGAVLIRVGARLASGPRSGVLVEPASAMSTFGSAG
jgi:hypothetical protein